MVGLALAAAGTIAAGSFWLQNGQGPRFLNQEKYGKIVAEGTAAELKEKTSTQTLEEAAGPKDHMRMMHRMFRR